LANKYSGVVALLIQKIDPPERKKSVLRKKNAQKMRRHKRTQRPAAPVRE
jgi:hypothetical protein